MLAETDAVAPLVGGDLRIDARIGENHGAAVAGQAVAAVHVPETGQDRFGLGDVSGAAQDQCQPWKDEPIRARLLREIAPLVQQVERAIGDGVLR